MVKVALKAWASVLLCLSLSGDVAALPTLEESSAVDLKALLTNPARQWASNTTVSFPSSAAFINATERWSTFSPPTYSAAISPGTEQDVSKVVWTVSRIAVHMLSFLLQSLNQCGFRSISPGLTVFPS
jgi:hypothetical protein